MKYLILFFKALTALILLIVLLALLGAAFSNIPSGKDWVDVMGALLTPVIGIAAILISYSQYSLRKQDSDQFRFDKRWEIYRTLDGLFEELRPHAGKDDFLEEFGREFDAESKVLYFAFNRDLYINVRKLVQSFVKASRGKKKENVLHLLEPTQRSLHLLFASRMK